MMDSTGVVTPPPHRSRSFLPEDLLPDPAARAGLVRRMTATPGTCTFRLEVLGPDGEAEQPATPPAPRR